MAVQDTRVVLVLALLFCTGVLLQILGCALYNNWWPMLAALMYVLVPMPYLFFDTNGYTSSSVSSGWSDAGKFLTGFSAIGSIAIPAILAHAGRITTGALLMELSAVVVLLSTAGTFAYFNERD